MLDQRAERYRTGSVAVETRCEGAEKRPKQVGEAMREA